MPFHALTLSFPLGLREEPSTKVLVLKGFCLLFEWISIHERMDTLMNPLLFKGFVSWIRDLFWEKEEEPPQSVLFYGVLFHSFMKIFYWVNLQLDKTPYFWCFFPSQGSWSFSLKKGKHLILKGILFFDQRSFSLRRKNMVQKCLFSRVFFSLKRSSFMKCLCFFDERSCFWGNFWSFKRIFSIERKKNHHKVLVF